MLYGHRNDIDGYAKALAYFDEKLPEIMAAMRDEDKLIITADHGCDPGYTVSTDHSREHTPCIMYGKHVRPEKLGTRETFADIGATVLDYLGVSGNIDDQMLENLLNKVNDLNISKQEVKYLEEELKDAKTLLYITDNCGEIVLDKIFIEELKKRYKNLEIIVMVRGGLAINDATIEDAEEVGLTKIVSVISNGAAITGTVKEQLSKEARKYLDSADVIIAKGMGNFESMFEEGINPYYLFLCKCELFTTRFGVQLFDPIFCKEERLEIKNK